MPAAQSVQEGDPALLHVPAVQLVHALLDVLRELGLNLPASQSVHEDDLAPLHLPAGHSISSVPPGQDVPAAHPFWLHDRAPEQQSEQV